MNSLAQAIRVPYRSIAVVTALALLAWTLGLPAWIHNAEALGLNTISDTLSDSDTSVDAEHIINFTTPTGLEAGEKILISFDPAGLNFDLGSVVVADVASSTTHAMFDALGSCVGGQVELYASIVSAVTDTVEYTMCPASSLLAPGSTVNLSIGVTGANDINNPAATTSYVIQIQTLTSGDVVIDSGDTRVAIIDDVTVTASVDTTFTFTINGVDADVVVNDDITDTSGTSTATTVPFGTIVPGTPSLMAQRLTVDTNALNGFAVTVQSDITLTAGNGATIDTFKDGATTSSSTIWVAPSATMGVTDTYGHWGLTSDDDVVSSSTPNLWGSGEALYVGNFIANPVEVFYHDTAVEQTAGVGVGSTTVAYKIQVSALQEAAKDYTATLTYIATPVF